VEGNAIAWLPAIQALPFVNEATAQDSTLTIRLDTPDVQNPQIVETLVTAGARVRYVQPIAHSLEEAYLELLSRA
jgi:ABC-2 type transport system ATP-binding protein